MGGQTLLLQVLLVTPVCQWLLTSGRFARPKNLLLAIAFLCAVAAASEGQEWMTRPPSLYSVLEVDRSAGPAELKTAFRKQSLQWHPDKNKAPEAAERFAAMQEAYDTLSDIDSRRVYERYGTSSKDLRLRSLHAQKSEQDVMLGMAMHYVIWSVLTYLMTIGKASAEARQWSFIGLIVCLFIEFQTLFSPGFDPLASILPRTPQFEKLVLLHSLYPPFMHGCRLLGQFLFVDMEMQSMGLMVAVLETNKEILVSLEQLIQAQQQGKKGGGGGAAGAAGNAAVQAAGATPGDALRGDESLPLAARMRRRQEAEQRAMQAQQQKASKTGGIPSWVFMVGMYALFHYLGK